MMLTGTYQPYLPRHLIVEPFTSTLCAAALARRLDPRPAVFSDQGYGPAARSDAGTALILALILALIDASIDALMLAMCLQQHAVCCVDPTPSPCTGSHSAFFVPFTQWDPHRDPRQPCASSDGPVVPGQLLLPGPGGLGSWGRGQGPTARTAAGGGGGRCRPQCGAR